MNHDGTSRPQSLTALESPRTAFLFRTRLLSVEMKTLWLGLVLAFTTHLASLEIRKSAVEALNISITSSIYQIESSHRFLYS
jgi:hypothetical protein